MKHKLEIDSIQLELNGKRILSDIYLKCETGNITGLLGRNGQGKSCLMQIIYGNLKCEKSIRFNNVSNYEAFKRPDLLRYLPQFNFIPKGLSLKQIFTDFDLEYSVFETLFPEFKTRYKSTIHKLSGGERRLIELYIIVKSNSQFAMLDEPFTHLNPIQIEKIKEFLTEEKANKGFLITDHMYAHLLEVSDTVYLLKDGKTHLTKTIQDLDDLGYVSL